ncbi:hypothetical protein RJ639_003806 [Escallonia herrerae]|uniref:Apple domain-containing protein n=1 Tax=Escallonia herrerae TaxID=1293975 RepID=A0AA88W4G9_9ASTE|nr:hypothetical protein RJ639_003806 [Escallonia herrerae]
MRKGSIEQYRTGPWNGVWFSGAPNLSSNTIFSFRLVFNDKEVYYTYDVLNSSVISRLMLSQNGVLQRWTWPVGRSQARVPYLTAPTDNCDSYALCGAYGTCNIGDSPQCRCLNKFAPKNSDAWANTDWSNGCIRKTPLACYNNGSDGFLKYSNVKLPDTRNSLFNVRMTLEECQKVCSNNCSCMAYANLDIRDGGSGCLLWFGVLIDIRDFPEGAGQDIYVRMASSDAEIGKFNFLPSIIGLCSCYTIRIKEKSVILFLCSYFVSLLDSEAAIPSAKIHNLVGTKTFRGPKSSSNRKKGVAMKVSLPLSVGMLLLGLILTLYVRKRKKNELLLKREGSFIANLQAWRLHQEDRSRELVDPTAELGKSSYLLEAMRSVQLGLLCVQKYPEDRPSMSSVVLMLGSDGGLPSPKQPGFFTERGTVVEKSESHTKSSNNDYTITLLDAR